MDWKRLIKKIVTAIACYLATAFVIKRMIINGSPQGLIVFCELMIVPLMAYIMNRISGDKGLKDGLKNALLACVVMVIYVQIFPNPLEGYSAGYDQGYEEYIPDKESHYQDSSVADNNQSTNQGTDDSQNNYDNLDGFTYNLSDIQSLDGYFCLKPSKGTLTKIHAEIEYDYWGSGMMFLNGKELNDYLRFGYTDFIPAVVNRTNGEMLVLVGDAWDGRSEKRKTEMEFYSLTLWGYGNPYLLPHTMVLSEFEEICGKNIASLNGDIEAINNALSDTTFKLYAYSGAESLFFDPISSSPLFLSSKYGETFTYGSYAGTEYIEQNVAMITPYYWHKKYEEPTVVPIEKTKEGYMIVDISALEEGLWLIDGLYPVRIK